MMLVNKVFLRFVASSIFCVVIFFFSPVKLSWTKGFQFKKTMASTQKIDFGLTPVRGLPKNPNYHPDISLGLSEYKIHYCLVNKCMMTAGVRTFCYMSDPVEYRTLLDADIFKVGPEGRPCADERKLDIVNAFRGEMKDWTHLTIIRHPIDRFISGYLMHCKQFKYDCYKCKKSTEPHLNCFVTNHYRHYLEMVRNKNEQKLWTHEYDLYPIMWYCDLANNRDKYTLIKYDSDRLFVDDFIGVFRNAGVSENATRKAEAALLSKTTSHASGKSRSKDVKTALFANNTLLAYVVYTYWDDFSFFDEDPEQFLIKHTIKET